MIILVTANNFLLMFVGWEGYHNSLKWLNLFLSTISKKIRNISSVNNNNKDNISLIVGSLLGNSYLEKNEKGVRIIFIKCNGNIEYLMQFYNYLNSIGYCKSKKPDLKTIISKNNKLLYYWKVESYYLTEFEWLYDVFYKNNKKTIPLKFKEYLTPLSLSVWYLDNTDKLYLSDNQSFNLNNENLDNILKILKDKYSIDSTYKLEGKSKVSFYIKNKSLNNFSRIVKPYISSSLQYKLNEPQNRLTMWSNLRLSSSFNSIVKNNVKYYSTNTKDIKYSAQYKNNYILTDIQREALLGIILGDGFIEKSKPTHNARIRIEQSYPEKSEYLKSLHGLLEPLTAMEPTLLTRNNKKRGTTTQSLYFRTLAMPCLNFYHELFYKDNIKVIPRNLEELLTARGLAYWIMDDGGKSVHNQTILHTRSFNKEEVEYLQTVLNQNFELRTRLEEKIEDQWVIYIPVRQKVKLKDIVGPYMHESMLYKV
jgi:LAGLIDADG DNA endonuclease family protein